MPCQKRLISLPHNFLLMMNATRLRILKQPRACTPVTITHRHTHTSWQSVSWYLGQYCVVLAGGLPGKQEGARQDLHA